MKKTVLFLINGFGIEQRDSFNIYNKELMPNLDKLTKEVLFSSIETSDYNLRDAYRTFSIETKDALTYPFLDTYSLKLKENPNFNNYVSNIKENSKFHLFCFIDNINSVEHIKNMLSSIDKEVILHVVLTNEDINDYSEISRILSKITLEVKNFKFGSIVGKNTMLNSPKDYVDMLENGIGEKWHEIDKKLNALEKSKIIPFNAKGFYVNDDFVIGKEDSVFLLNYEYYDITNFLERFKQIYSGNIFSMFPLKGGSYALYSYPTSGISLVNSLKSIAATGLIIADENNFGFINYFANGLKKVSDNSLLFMKTENDILYNKDIMTNTLKNDKFNLIIINHTIDDCKTITELNEKLKKIDESLAIINDICATNNYSLVVSSLYGMKKEIAEDQYIKRLVNFSTKVPLIISDKVYKKNNYNLTYGNVIGLKNTCFKLVNLEYKGSGLITKKSFLYKLLKKS